MTKSSFGIRIDDELVEKLSQIMDDSRYLNITRSEIIETLLAAELSDQDSAEKIQELIIKRREGRLNSDGEK
jgi:metal-responsive CopG/Arc/MetJ family transcriptional regulator